MRVRPLIEQWFPAPIVGAESLRDASAAKKPPVSRLHVWWARRPLTVSRAAVVSSLLPAWPSEDEATSDPASASVLRGLQSEFPGGERDYHEWFIRTLGILGDPVAGRAAIAAANATGVRLDGNGYGYARAFSVTPDAADIERIRRLALLRAETDPIPSVLDPFAGGGAIPFEAARFGCRSLANEINPVAIAILQGTVNLPAVLGPEFADILTVWGKRWSGMVEKRLRPYFPKASGVDSTVAYIWAHTVPCPSTGRPTPLAPDYWLAHGKAGRDVAVRLRVETNIGSVTIEIVEGTEAAKWGDISTYKDGTATSIWTGETFGGDYIRERALAGDMGVMLLAVCVTFGGRPGRTFRAPSPEDYAAVESAGVELERRLPDWEINGLVPTEEIPPGHKTDEPRRMGLLFWRQLFTKRQLLCALTALEELQAVLVEARAEIGDEQAKHLGLYLALALDKTVDYNGMLSSWHSTRTTVRNVFDRHDFAFKWSFAEFDGASASVPWGMAQVIDAYRGIARLAHRAGGLMEDERNSPATILYGSAAEMALPAASVDAVVTDPPYYDNVMYAECSDYFYVWLKRSLRETWPELCGQVLTDKEGEAVANPSLFKDVSAPAPRRKKGKTGKTASELADEHYERLLTQCFGEANRVLKDDGVMTVMFTHKRVDAWDTLGQALLQAGFSINSSWPVHTESEHSLHQAKKNSASSTILLTCRKRGSTEPAYWTDIRGDVARAARDAASRFSADGLAGIDLTLSTFGPVLSVLSKRWPVYTGDLDDNGKPLVVRPDVALDLAREEVARLKKRGLLGGRDVEFDRVTDWYLLAWSDFGAAEFPAGEALKLSIATHLELDDLARQHRVIRASAGFVTILTPAQRRTAHAIDLTADSYTTMLDALHSLMLVYEEDGLPAARAWLERTGRKDDQRFSDLVSAALRAVPRRREKGQFVRPEAAALEGLRATMFENIAAPPEPGDAAAVQPTFAFSE
jgi:putative DNA methylase